MVLGCSGYRSFLSCAVLTIKVHQNISFYSIRLFLMLGLNQALYLAKKQGRNKLVLHEDVKA